MELNLELTTISKGYSSGVQDGVYKTFSSTEAWDPFWSSHTSNTHPAPAAPVIDFSRNLVIAAVRSTCNSGGYDVEIVQVRETLDNLVVYVSTRDPAPGSMTTCALTQPFHLVQCEHPGENKPVEFVSQKWVPPPPSKYTFMVGFHREEEAADVLNKEVGALDFVVSVKLLGAVKIGIVTVDAALVDGAEAARKLLEKVGGIKYAELDG